MSLTRRRFLSKLTLAIPASSPIVRAMAAMSATHLGFAGIDAMDDAGSGRIEVYRVDDGHWGLVSATAAIAPHAIVLHPTLPVLYVAHCVAEHQHRPRGSVSAFCINKVAASLSPLSHEPLTLAATLPDRIAIAPDGRHLLIASSTAAVFNLFPLRSDGSLIPTPSPLKLHGLSSSQLSIAFHASSTSILATTSNRVERLDIRSDSSLVRGLPLKVSQEITTQRDSTSNAIKRELTAQHAASQVMLTL